MLVVSLSIAIDCFSVTLDVNVIDFASYVGVDVFNFMLRILR